MAVTYRPRPVTEVGAQASRSEIVPPGTVPVGIGLVVTGLTAYGYLLLTARVLGPARFTAVSVLWAVVFLTGPGLFLPLQQEVGRLVAYRRVEGVGGGAVIRRAALAGSCLAGVVLVVAGALSGPIDRHLFDSEVLLFVGFLLALIGYFLLALLWGALAGAGRFGYYATAQASDGVLRMIICTVLALVGVRTAGPYGLVLGMTPIIAAAFVAVPNTDLLEPGPSASMRDLSGALGWLLLGSVAAQTLINASVIAVKLFATPAQQAQAGHFLSGVIIARLPLFFFGAVQAALLPRLASLARAGRIAEFRVGLTRLMGVVAVVGVLAVVGAYAIGPAVVKIAFGANYVISRTDLLVLAAGSSAYMLALCVVQAIIAVGRHARSAVCWLSGVVTFGVVISLVHGLYTRVEYAFLAGSAVTLLCAVALLVPNLRQGSEILDPDRLIVSLGSLELEP